MKMNKEWCRETALHNRSQSEAPQITQPLNLILCTRYNHLARWGKDRSVIWECTTRVVGGRRDFSKTTPEWAQRLFNRAFNTRYHHDSCRRLEIVRKSVIQRSDLHLATGFTANAPDGHRGRAATRIITAKTVSWRSMW